MKTALDVMTKTIVEIDPDATVAEAIAMMKAANVSSLLIRRKTPGRMWGFMTQTDVIEKVVAHDLDPASVAVRDIMTMRIISVPPTASLKDCAALMARADIRRVLVFDGNEVLGIVSSSDIFNAL